MIVEYLGPFGKNGKNINKTRIRVQCDWCENESESTFLSLKSRTLNYAEYAGQLCGICNTFGNPVYPTDVIQSVEFIVDVDCSTLGTRSDVCKKTMVLCVCDMCGEQHYTRYERVVNSDRYLCHKCGTAYSKSHMLYPNDVIGAYGIIDVDLETLGVLGQVIDKSSVLFRCNCGNESWIGYGHATRKGHEMCHSCISKHAMTDDRKQQISEVVTIAWKNDKIRANMLNGRHEIGYLTAPHQRLKDAMLDSGISSFESERWICKYKYRADEVDKVNDLVVEMFGDFYHANPEQYRDDDILNLPGGAMYAHEVWERDAKRILEIEKDGYSVFVVWEHEINENPDRVMSKLLDWYHKNVGE